MAHFTGTTGDDVQSGNAGQDTLNFSQGGQDTLAGRGGADTFKMGGAFDALDVIDGGRGFDTLVLNGAYGAPIAISAASLVRVEQITLLAGNAYSLNLAAGLVGAGASLAIDGSALAAGQSLTVTADPLMQGALNIAGGAGDDTVTMALTAGSTVDGGAGNDTVTIVSGTVEAGSLQGGDGTDTLSLDQTVLAVADFSAAATGFENLDLGEVSGDDTANVIDLSTFTSADSDGTYKVRAEGGDDTVTGLAGTSGRLHGNEGADQLAGQELADRLRGNWGDDGLSGGAGDDLMKGGEGADFIRGGDGADTFFYSRASQSTGSGFDIIRAFDADVDGFNLTVIAAPTAFDAAIVVGSLSFHNFDAELAAAADATHLGANHAVLFTPDAGRYAGETFLVIDANGVAGYQAGEDLVLAFDKADNLGNLGIDDFITA